MTQTAAIERHLRAGRVLNPLEALRRFGVFRLAARVYDLRARGLDVRTRRLKTRTGKRVALYWMPPQ